MLVLNFTGGGGGCEERSPEPKPRWNPKPEQIRILEAIFNSGMVNPPRDEIRKTHIFVHINNNLLEITRH